MLGLRTTFFIGIGSMLGAVVGGVLIAIIRTEGSALPRSIARVFVEVVRNTPLLIQMFLVYFGLPQMGVMIDPWGSIILTLVLHYTAYIGEILRANIESIPRTQREAGLALGMLKSHVVRRVVLPQAIRHSVPAINNQLVYLVKDTSLSAFFGVKDVMFAAIRLQVDYWRVFEAYITVGLVYLLLSLVVSIIGGVLERRWAIL